MDEVKGKSTMERKLLRLICIDFLTISNHDLWMNHLEMKLILNNIKRAHLYKLQVWIHRCSCTLTCTRKWTLSKQHDLRAQWCSVAIFVTIVLSYVTLCSLFSSLRSLNYVSAHLYYRPNMGKDTVHLFASDTQFFFLILDSNWRPSVWGQFQVWDAVEKVRGRLKSSTTAVLIM